MKRYLIPILIIVVLAPGVLVACGQDNKPAPLPDKPRRSEKQMTYALYDYFFEEVGFNTYWARPLFLPDEQWTASYNGEGNWVVKAYDIDGSYAGAWLVPEAAHYGEDYDRVEPYDDEAKLIASGARRIAKMPPLPNFAKYPDAVDPHNPDTSMIQRVQAYIANMSRSEAEDAFITDIWQAVRNHYPLEWYISYNDSMWFVVADYYEYRVKVYVDPYTGQITVFGD